MARYRLELEPASPTDRGGETRLMRQLLKRLLRAHGWRCLHVAEIETSTTPGGGTTTRGQGRKAKPAK